MEIKKIRLKELKSFAQSKDYEQLTTVPITPARIKSYLNNPNAKPDDVVLYLGIVQNKLVAFRTLFAECVYIQGKNIRFGWCSGNWVDPANRRSGFSQQLLKEAHSDWNGNLMFTNYAPNSEKLYLKTGWFYPIHKFNGARAYLFPKTKKLIANSNSNKGKRFVLSFIDIIIYIIITIRLLFYKETVIRNIKLEIVNEPDNECYDLSNKDYSNFLFKRQSNELKWIFMFPWISNKNSQIKNKYPFSSTCADFQYKTVKLFEEGEFVGFFIFSVREGHLKTLYFNIPTGMEKDITIFLKSYSKKHKIEMLTVYNTEIAQQLLSQKFPFLHVKKFGQKIYSSFEINKDNNYRFQDGDGDVIFT